MSEWTHVLGVMYVDSGIMGAMFGAGSIKTSVIAAVQKTLPTGSEGPIDSHIEDHGSRSFTLTVCGDLRDFSEKDCDKIYKWWSSIARAATKEGGLIRMSLLAVEPEYCTALVHYTNYDVEQEMEILHKG